ncbi:MAG: iron ABC transporter permease [Methylacidiphilales bacterium]|nr:iron ABC transporter permease [Candidatus Methylacidiphilales bacterium]
MKKFLLIFLAFFFALFLLYPLFTLLGGAFYVETQFQGHTLRHFSLQYFLIIFENPFYRECFINSLLLAVWTTLFCLLLSIPLAWVFTRRIFPGKQILSRLLLLPLILPPFVGAIGLKQFFARFGSLNLLLNHIGLIDLKHPPDWFGSGGFFGIILLQVLHLYPILFLSVQAALANLDPSLRDAAQNLGARGWHVFRSITLPLAMPGIFAGASIVFVGAFTDLGVPLMFDFQTTVPTQIFNLVTQTDNPLGYALVVLTLALVAIIFLLGRKCGEGNYSMLGRSAVHSDVIRLKPAAGCVVTCSILFLIGVSILPHLSVILQSFAARWFMTVLPAQWSGEYFTEIFHLELTTLSIRNSLFYSICSAALDLLLGLGIAWLLAREKFKGRSLLDVMAMLPLALPGLVLAFAYFTAFSHPPLDPSWFGIMPAHSAWIQSFNRVWLSIFDPRQNPFVLLVVAYSVHRLPYIVRAAFAGFQQMSVSLEEASANLGARPWQTLLKISVPLIGANLIAGGILVFSFAMLDVSNGMVLAQESRFYPMTKAIYSLMGRITPTAPSIACALGVLSMLLLAASLFMASRLLGRRMGQLFKA